MATKLSHRASTGSSMSNHRPKSRQSTTSVQSNTSQLVHALQTDQPFDAPQPPMPSEVWQQHERSMNQISHGIPGYHSLSADASSVQHANVPFPTDNSFGGPLRMDSPADYMSIEGQDDSLMDGTSQLQTAGGTTGDGSRRKKASSSGQANDQELRRLFRENENKSLHEIAQQVLKDDKGPKSEKNRQIFGMIWLHQNIKRSTASVPRNRVFTAYSDGCSNEHIQPLNPASFGKLVRIIFPGIQTRRLGVRGESKYHYVELSLVNDTGRTPPHPPGSRAASQVADIVRNTSQQKAQPIQPRIPLDTASFPLSPDSVPMNHSQPVLSKGSLYMQTTQHLASSSRPNMIVRPLKFPTRETAPPSAEFQLPDIEPYLPPGTDRDAVQSLLSVYRNHCLLVIDSFRYCKADKLCDSYKSMVGLLTVPGQKLLAHPSIAPWIKKCDWLKYQKMFPMLDMIILTQVPGKAMLQLENISLGLCSWISTFFHAQPQHVQDAMFGPAHVFKSLLDRFLRVNRSAVDVADILANPDNRDQLWRDWVNHVNPYHVLQNSLQEHGHKRVLHMLTQEVRFLLTPMEDPQLALGDSLFADNGVRSDFQSMMLEQGNTSSSQILHRLAKFIESIAPRFPGLNARSILNYIDIIGNNISRDLSFNGAPCLANWWRVRLFVDEMSYWLAEKGGFLENGVESMTPHLRSPFASFNFDTTNDFGPKSSTSSAFEPQPDQSRFPDTSVQKQPEQDPSRSRGNSTVVEDDGLGGVPDDSGIGLGLDDDFEMDTKYNSFVGGVHGSDPADVVVC